MLIIGAERPLSSGILRGQVPYFEADLWTRTLQNTVGMPPPYPCSGRPVAGTGVSSVSLPFPAAPNACSPHPPGSCGHPSRAGPFQRSRTRVQAWAEPGFVSSASSADAWPHGSVSRPCEHGAPHSVRAVPRRPAGVCGGEDVKDDVVLECRQDPSADAPHAPLTFSRGGYTSRLTFVP